MSVAQQSRLIQDKNLTPKQKRPKALTLSLSINGGPSVSRTQHQRIMSPVLLYRDAVQFSFYESKLKSTGMMTVKFFLLKPPFTDS